MPHDSATSLLPMPQCDWLGERVATVDVDRAIANVINNKEDAGWGPNAVFRFPQEGGTGGIWKAVAKLLPLERQQYNKQLVAIDKEAQVPMQNHCEGACEDGFGVGGARGAGW